MKQEPTRSKESLCEILHVEKLVASGVGFGRRTSGEPVFVRGAVPGDSVELRKLEKHKGFSRALEFRVQTPSSDRRSAPCEYQTRCGGCDLMVLDERAQRTAKHAMVLDILKRTAKLDATTASPVPLTWHDSLEHRTLGYRSRIRLHISNRGQLGFLAEQSHSIVEVSRCLVATPTLNEVLRELTYCAAQDPQLLAAFEQVEIRTLGEHPDLLWFPRLAGHGPTATRPNSSRRNLRPAASPPNAQAALEALATLRRSLQNLAPSSTHWLMSVRSDADSWRSNAQTAPLIGSEGEQVPRLLFAPGMFTQVNWQVNQAIIRKLLKEVTERGLGTFLDLYCGAGNFSLPLLASGLDGLGIESNPLSIHAALSASRHQSLGGRFVSGDVPKKLGELVEREEKFDLVLLDPPRSGFKEASQYLPALARKAVFVCACDPTTFARDLRSLLDLGFTLDCLEAYDMFPQTHHVELTAWLRPKFS